MQDDPHTTGAVQPSSPMRGSLPAAGPSTPPSLPPSLPKAAAPATLTAQQLAPPHGRLSDAQADAVARMVIQGRPLSLISMAVGRSEESLRRMISGSLRPRIDEIRAQVMRETATHWFEMLAMLPQVRLNIQNGLLSQDERVRLEMTRWVHERIVPPAAVRQEVEHTVHFGEEVQLLLGAMTEKLEAIQRDNVGRDPLAAVRRGPDALPRAVVIRPEAERGDGAA